MVAALTLRASACSVPSPMFINNYIAAINEYAHTADGGSTFVNGGNVSLPLSVYVKVTPVYTFNNVVAIPITNLKLQYKVKTPGNDWGADWTDCRAIDNPDWKVDFENGPVALFGRDVLDVPDLQAGSEIMIRVWMSTGLYFNANTDDDTDDTGANGWGQNYVVRVVYDGHRKPVLKK